MKPISKPFSPNFPNYQYVPKLQNSYHQNHPNQSNNYISNQYPRNPINIQSRPVKKNFPTNKQVFGQQKNPTNVWKPQPSTSYANKPKLTPMSGISHGTHRPSTSFQFPQRPQQTYQSKFVSEELYNVDYTDDCPNSPDYSYYNSDSPDYLYDSTEIFEQNLTSDFYENQVENSEDQNFHDVQIIQDKP